MRWLTAPVTLPHWVVLCFLLSAVLALLTAALAPSETRRTPAPLVYVCVLHNHASQVDCRRGN